MIGRKLYQISTKWYQCSENSYIENSLVSIIDMEKFYIQTELSEIHQPAVN